MPIYKVVTQDLRSLGLRRNPTILQFPVGQWVSSPTVAEGRADAGGIWVAVDRSGARSLSRYMAAKGISTRTFLCLIGRELYKNSYRLKTDRVKLLSEVSFGF